MMERWRIKWPRMIRLVVSIRIGVSFIITTAIIKLMRLRSVQLHLIFLIYIDKFVHIMLYVVCIRGENLNICTIGMGIYLCAIVLRAYKNDMKICADRDVFAHSLVLVFQPEKFHFEMKW